MTATCFMFPATFSTADSHLEKPSGYRKAKLVINERDFSANSLYLPSPVYSDNLINASQANEFPQGVALSCTSLGRRRRFSPSFGVSKNPPDRSWNFSIISSASSFAETNHLLSKSV